MKHVKILLLVGCVGLFGALFVPGLKADPWDQKTIMTFSGPFEIPGIVLPAGTYVFRLLDPTSNQNIVQILSADEQKVYATILAIPDYRVNLTDKTVVSFEERAAGAPEAIKAWFYPDNHNGQEFVYPKPRAIELAKANHIEVPAMPAEMAKNVTKPAKSPEVEAMRHAPVTTIQPSGKEVPRSEAHASAMKPAPPAATAMTEIKHLPKSSSALPLMGLLGIVSVAGGSTLRLLAGKNL
jgi:hypothetical protein